MPLVPLLILLQVSLPAPQRPDTTELNSRTDVPLMRANSRTQMFWDATAAGTSSLLISQALSFRFDGPGTTTAPTTFTATRLQLLVGTTTRQVAQLTPAFAGNLSTPLTTVFDGAFSYVADRSTIAPDPWGTPTGQLRFPVAAPIALTIPNRGCLVVEVVCRGNTNTSPAAAWLDAHDTFAYGNPPGLGTAVTVPGTLGCPATAAGMDATTQSGAPLAPGQSLSAWGTNLGASNPVITWLGHSTANWLGYPLPIQVPGTSCSVWIALTFPLLTQIAGPTGAIVPFAAGGQSVVPPDPLLDGATLFLQNMSVGPPHAANPYGLFFGQAIRVTLGGRPAASSVWHVTHVQSATATIASHMSSLGVALRLE